MIQFDNVPGKFVMFFLNVYLNKLFIFFVILDSNPQPTEPDIPLPGSLSAGEITAIVFGVFFVFSSAIASVLIYKRKSLLLADNTYDWHNARLVFLFIGGNR